MITITTYPNGAHVLVDPVINRAKEYSITRYSCYVEYIENDEIQDIIRIHLMNNQQFDLHFSAGVIIDGVVMANNQEINDALKAILLG